MAIKPMRPEDIPPARNHSNKLELLAKDIKDAMKDRVEYWEFMDFPYSPKTGIRDILNYAERIVAHEFYKITGVKIARDKAPITMRKAKDDNGHIHIYGTFDYDAWDKLIEEVRKTLNGNK